MNNKSVPDRSRRKIRTLAQLKVAVEDMTHGGPSSDGVGDGWICIERDELRMLLGIAEVVVDGIKKHNISMNGTGLSLLRTLVKNNCPSDSGN